MADETATTEQAPITFTVKSSTDAKYTLTLPLTTLVSDLKQKLSTPENADTPAERQRLIYSGRVLKDTETLETYKIKDGHTIHLVKSAASNQQRQNTAAQPNSASAAGGATPAIAGVPTNLAAGTGNNPLAGLTGARYAGFAQLPGAGLFGPDGGVSELLWRMEAIQQCLQQIANILWLLRWVLPQILSRCSTCSRTLNSNRLSTKLCRTPL